MIKEVKQKEKQEQKVSRAGIPKDWIAPSMQISSDIKFCDMKVDMKQYALQITQYIYVQMVKTQIAYLKDAAEYIKKSFQQEYQGCWHVVCGVIFGSYFNYQKIMLDFLFGNMVDFIYSIKFVQKYFQKISSSMLLIFRFKYEQIIIIIGSYI